MKKGTAIFLAIAGLTVGAFTGLYLALPGLVQNLTTNAAQSAAKRFEAAGYAVTFVPHERYHAVPPDVVKRAALWIKARVLERVGSSVN